MNFRVPPNYKTRNRVGNWTIYEKALVQRGDINFWITPEAIEAWKQIEFVYGFGSTTSEARARVQRPQPNAGARPAKVDYCAPLNTQGRGRLRCYSDS